MKSVLNRIWKFLKPERTPVPAGAAPGPVDIGGLTIEALWNDFERRTWHYKPAGATLGNTDPRLLNWIGSIDYSGFIREKCLRSLISGYVAGDENRILLRLADWVPQVQNPARDWILVHFRSLPMDAIRANQRLILHLTRKERLRSDPGLEEIMRNLLDRTRAMGSRRFFGLETLFRRHLFLASLDGDGHLRRWMLDDPDPFTRILLVRGVGVASLTDDEIKRLGADGSGVVRRRFLYARIDAGITPARQELVKFALDPGRGVRELGQYYLKTLYQDDAYAIYKGSEGEAFFHIADYGREEDAGHFLTGVRTGKPATRYNCLRALVMVARDRLGELDLADLIGRSRKLRAVLLPVLPGILSLESIFALRRPIEDSGSCGVLSFLRVLERKSFWAFLDECLDLLLAEPGHDVESRVVQLIRNRVEILEKLTTSRRNSIVGKTARLRENSSGRFGGLASYLDFILKCS